MASRPTRALQEQAASKEVPRALQALARAANLDAPRVSVLKGRGNYLCWRALRALDPSDEDSSHAWLAWTSLVVFAGIHAEADLDRFALRPALIPGEEWQAELYRELETLVAGARASGMCCIAREDRDTCAAELARQRAERSHVVITNHAFVLARQGFFRHLIADECEHLHEQAHGAWSHELSLRRVHSVLDRLGGKRRKHSRALLARLERQPGLGELLAEATQRAQEQRGTAQHAAEQLEQSLEGFKFWREQARQTREERDLHSLLREFVEQCGELPAAAALVECQRGLWDALHLLEVDLSDIVERLQALKQPGLGGLRRGLELARADLVAMQQALEAWIPLEGNPPNFLAETFYDLETDARGQDSMVARVLLPNEFLGRKFLPELASGVLLSATTWLRGGFEAALGYLGLDRAAHPAPDEERDPRVVRTFRAPDPFDYSNVVVCIPRDAPAVTAGKDAVLSYVRRFLAYLGERTRGRILALFTNADDLKRVGLELEPFFAAKGIPFWYQNMPGQRKEELASLFRDGTDSILLGVDTFWFGADFPGESLEYLVIVRLPYGVPDQYHHAQCAALGAQEQRRRIYLPRALSKFRQGFGRLMRRESDRGAVFVLDSRILDGRHRFFLSELPLAAALAGTAPSERCERGAALVTAGTDGCVAAALNHMGVLEAAAKRGLTAPFAPNPIWQVDSKVVPPPKAPRGSRKPRGSPRQADQTPGPDQAANEAIEF